jgi:hypothetical protein
MRRPDPVESVAVAISIPLLVEVVGAVLVFGMAVIWFALRAHAA